jgi:phytoene dehydrogenase-like protein
MPGPGHDTGQDAGQATRPDVVVVGAGHNALIAACYLAREGLGVEVVERDTVLGGAVSTVERFPGYRIDRGSSLHIMIRLTGIVEELRLAECGLHYLDCDPWGFFPIAGAPGGGITFSVDLDRTCASIEAVCGSRDADAYRAFVTDWGARNERVFAAFAEPPTGRSLGRALWGTGRGTGLPGLELARQFLMPGDALLDSLFDDERLKTALSWLGAQSGPPMTDSATADLVGWNAMLHRQAPGRAVGGSGALSEALRKRLQSWGGTVSLGDAVTGIEVRGGRAAGVLTASGRRIRARAVLAGCHVLTTHQLLGGALATRAAARTRDIRIGDGLGMILRLGTTAPPVYPGAPVEAGHGMVLAVPDRAALRLAHGEFGAGRTPSRPPVLVMTPSLLDASLAPPSRHTVSVWAQWYPYELAGGRSWDDERKRVAETILAEVDRVAPGLTSSIEHLHVQTPLDLERELGLLRGNVMHVEMTLDAMFAWRPLPELAGYRGPVEGLYLCGASTHPGGGVFGASGRSSARVLLRDLAGRRGRLAGAARRAAHALPGVGAA